MRVLVEVATRGDRDLSPLVDALARQVLRPSHVVVASQGGDGGCRVAASRTGIPVSLVRVPRPGFTSGRNALLRFVQLTRGRWDAVAWIDDDEVPDEGWLASHVDALETHQADVSFGPIRRVWPALVSPAVRRADLPARPDYPAGAYDDDGRTGNCLLRASSLVATGLRFDDRLGGVGGEDTTFFRELRRRGAAMVWAPEAVVHEWLRRDECTWQAVLRRAYRNGSTLHAIPCRQGRSRRRAALRELRRGVKAGLLVGSFVLTARRDFLLRAGWEVGYLAGLARHVRKL